MEPLLNTPKLTSNEEPSEKQNPTYCFAIFAIVGLVGSLTSFGIGTAGYCQLGALDQMAQTTAVTWLTAGGGGGFALFIIGLVGNHLLKKEKIEIDPYIPDLTTAPFRFGKKEWKHFFNIDLEIPTFEISSENSNDPFEPERLIHENYIAIWIPDKINGRKFDLPYFQELLGKAHGQNKTNITLVINTNAYEMCNVTDLFPTSGWVLIRKEVCLCDQVYQDPFPLLNKHCLRAPSALEAAFALFAQTITGAIPLLNKYSICTDRSTRCTDTYQYNHVAVCIGKCKQHSLIKKIFVRFLTDNTTKKNLGIIPVIKKDNG